jgi:hypothetical protein
MADKSKQQLEAEAKQLKLLEDRNKNSEKIVKVEKDLLKKSEEQKTAMKSLTDEVVGIGNNLMSGAESLTTSIFGGTLGGILNVLTTGMVKRKLANKKAEEKAADEKEKQEKAAKEARDKIHQQMMDQMRKDKQYADMTDRQLKIKILAAENAEKQNEAAAEGIEAEKKINTFLATKIEKHEKDGGEVESKPEPKTDTAAAGGAVDTGGATLADVVSTLDFTNELLYDGLFGSPPLLKSVLENQETDLDNQESKEDRRERLRNEKNKSKGGSVVKKPAGQDDDGMDLGSLAGIAKMLLPAGALAGATAILGTGLSMLGAVALPLVIVGAAMKAIYDGFVGWMSSEDWGVSKVSGALGGFFGGAADGGIANAFMNAGKFAIMGAAIGSVVPVVGTIVGGLLGAAIGGIMGFIGAKKLAEGFDAIGTWFKDSFMAIWDVVMPDWVKQIDFQWTDIFPTMLVKLFNGEYFTVDVPNFSWYSLFPNFLVEWFKGTAEKISEKPWSWTDIFPKFLKDFFTGEIAKDTYVFSWTDLFPEWMVKIFDSTAEAFNETPFTWYSLFPDWLVTTIKGVKITGGTDAWEWTDLFPGWLTKVFKAGKEKGTTEKGFDWTLLLPDWMAAAWDSTKAIGEKTGITPLFEMIKKIFTDLFDQILSLIPGKETLDKVMKVVDDPIGAVGDAASSTFSFLKSAVGIGDDKEEGAARGGFIVNKPTYLPSSGIVVGEHGTYSGRGAAAGGIADGGPEAVIPLSSSRSGAFIDPMARSVAGAVMNQLQMERGMMSGGGSDASVVTGNDMSNNQVSNNTTVINNPSPIGQTLPDEGRDFVSKVA